MQKITVKLLCFEIIHLFRSIIGAPGQKKIVVKFDSEISVLSYQNRNTNDISSYRNRDNSLRTGMGTDKVGTVNLRFVNQLAPGATFLPFLPILCYPHEYFSFENQTYLLYKVVDM